MSVKVQFVSTPLSSYSIVKQASTAVISSSSCMYNVFASGCHHVDVLCCSTVGQSKYSTLLLIENTYANMHSKYDFCNGNVKAAVLE